MPPRCDYYLFIQFVMLPNVKRIVFIIVIFFSREVCKNEYIIPLGQELTALYEDPQMGHSLRSLQTESVRPQMKMTEISYVIF